MTTLCLCDWVDVTADRRPLPPVVAVAVPVRLGTAAMSSANTLAPIRFSPTVALTNLQDYVT